MIEISNVTKRFGGLVAVNGMNVVVDQKEILGLIGPNGAGKTTLFNCIAGYFRPEEGHIRLESENITGLGPERVCKAGIARTFQAAKPFGDLTVQENVMVGAFNRTNAASTARREADDCMALTGIAHLALDLARGLTLCDKKKMEICRALATKPKYILFDEVMAGLNPTEVHEIIELLRKLNASGIGLVIIEHIMSAIMNVSDRIIVMLDGRLLAEGKPADIASNPAVVEAYLGKVKKYA